MAFKMRCPKCGCTSFSIERDRAMRTPGSVSTGITDLIFSCRCGKQMFGEQVVTEHERQMRQYEAEGETRRREMAVVEARRRDEEEQSRARRMAHAFRSAHLDAQRREADALIRAREEENRRWLERLEEQTAAS